MSMMKNSKSNSKIISNTLKLLSSGNNDLRPAGNRESILILGNKGSGKTTFSQYISGYDDNLISVEVREGSGEYIITPLKSRTNLHSLISSKNLLPVLYVSQTWRTLFYDCPAFSETRRPSEDIASAYLLKKVIDSSRRIKIILLVNYASVRRGANRGDFMHLVNHVASLIQDIDKFKDSIALIVTKVDNQFIKKGNEVKLAADDKVIEALTVFLKAVKKDLSSQDEQSNIKIVKLIDMLIEKEGDTFSKMGIFRRPNSPGPISESELLQERKESLEIIVLQNTKFVTFTESDFNYRLGRKSKEVIHELADEINKRMTQEVIQAGQLMIQNSIRLETNAIDIVNLSEHFKKLNYNRCYLVSKYESGMYEISMNFIKKVLKDIEVWDSSQSLEISLKVMNLDDYLDFLEFEIDESLKTPPGWAEGFKDVSLYHHKSNKWYKFLNQLNSWLSSNDVQENRLAFNTTTIIEQTKIQFDTDINVDKIDFKQLLTNVIYYFPSEDINKVYEVIQDIPLNYAKLKNLRQVILSSLNNELEYSCQEEGRLAVKGFIINLSEIEVTCPQEIKFLEIFATGKVIINKDCFLIGKKMQLSIISPIWEVVGYKQIFLDGKAGDAHGVLKSVKQGMTGLHGKPGNHGGPAGNFLGVGHVVSGKLQISLVGGAGGPGQKGGIGGDGVEGLERRPVYLNGRSTSRLDKHSFGIYDVFPHDNWKKEGWKYLIEKEEYISAYLGFTRTSMFHYLVFGSRGEAGGSGGDGGEGGLGGSEGIAILVFSRPKEDNVQVSSGRGQKGLPGLGGKGGPGGRDGNTLHFTCEVTRNVGAFGITDCFMQHGTRSYGKRAQRGPTGKTGGIHHKTSPEPALQFVNPPGTIIRYKNFVREKLPMDIQASTVLNFISDFDDRRTVKDIYNTLSYVEELESLENQYTAIREHTNVLPFYQSLLDRIESYVRNPKDGEKTQEYKKVLTYLYTATLSKITNLNNENRKKDLIIDLLTYLDIAEKRIKELESVQSNVATDNVMNSYTNGIEEQIKVAKDNIALINSEFESIFGNINEEIEKIIENLHEARDEAEKQKAQVTLDKFQANIELKKAMARNQLLKALKIIVIAVTALVSIAATVVSGGAAAPMVIGVASTAIQMGMDIYATVSETGETIKNYVDEPLKAFETTLKDIIKLFPKMKKRKAQLGGTGRTVFLGINARQETGSPTPLSCSMEGIYYEVMQTQKKLDDKSSNSIDEMREELDSFLSDCKSEAINEKKDDVVEVINAAKFKLSLKGLPLDVYKKISSDSKGNEKIGLNEQLSQLDEEIANIKNFEKNINAIIVPVFNHLKNIVTDVDIPIDKISQLIDIKSWKIQDMINDVKSEVSHIVKDYNMGEELIRGIEKVDQALTTIFKIYERIVSFQDQAKLAGYIADINSPTSAKIQISDRKLKSAINLLELSIKSNILLEHYNRAMGAFTQSVFPFAHVHLGEFSLPSSFNLETSFENLIFIATKKLGALKDKLLESASVINLYDYYIHPDIVFSGATQHNSPFYVWDSDSNKLTISKLMSGLEVRLKANIADGINDDAIKFNEIGLNFKSRNTSLQTDLNKLLEDYELIMTHHGHSSYRCGRSFYIIFSEEQSFRFTILKDKNGVPVNKNSVYDKVKRNEPLLSPYTAWSFKLLPTRDGFVGLNRFVKESIDLELVGRGQYLDKGIRETDICNKQLEQYYELDKGVTEFSSFDEHMMETKGKSNKAKEKLEQLRTAKMNGRKRRYLKEEEEHFIRGSNLTLNRKIGRATRRIYPWDLFREGDTSSSSDSGVQWQNEKVVSSEDWVNVKSLVSSPPYTSHFPDNSSLKSNGNLLLWNLLFRKFSQTDASSSSRKVLSSQSHHGTDGQQLAYRYHLRK